ncbi:NADH/F420H2 dehydrogenase subunit C [Ilumatobacter fluminis]|uniref:NADH-quinone oxidoreductase subunit C n=1 Tax=Ilumatobacter fluminis TaxID=467091 RepID=A0A4R7HW09_9ACTN|nr:NADH-quinone oxidoreductase subunit C [Ilumatobacter fluminis]TDT15247.1 NADH/F420H2 dehydrogenase subunit C [Ilumatobacter fluminis]
MSDIDNDTDAPEISAEIPTVHDCIAGESCGQTVVFPTREQYVDLVKKLADDGYSMIIDLCGVDYLEYMDRPLPDDIVAERFEVVVNLLDITHRRRIRLRVQVPEAEPTIPTLFDVHPGAEAYERETYDMFGVVFTEHPDMTRILMPEDWVGHPLRKDYAVGKIPVQFKGAHS